MSLVFLPDLLVDGRRRGKLGWPLTEHELQSSVLSDVIKWLRILEGASAERIAEGKKRDPNNSKPASFPLLSI